MVDWISSVDIDYLFVIASQVVLRLNPVEVEMENKDDDEH